MTHPLNLAKPEHVEQKAQWLIDNIQHTANKDRKFVADIAVKTIIGQATAGRTKWVEIMFDRAWNASQGILTGGLVDYRPSITVPNAPQPSVDLSALYNFVMRPRGKLQRPGIRVKLPGIDRHIRVGVCGRGFYRGKVVVEHAEWDYNARPGRTTYGVFDEKGNYTPVDPRMAKPQPELMTGLQAMNASEATIIEYGKATGRCFFCGASLDDERSTAVGYGPTCAGHYGLKDEWRGGIQAIANHIEKEAVIEKRRAEGKAVNIRHEAEDADYVTFE